jgi:hypothetical protein
LNSTVLEHIANDHVVELQQPVLALATDPLPLTKDVQLIQRTMAAEMKVATHIDTQLQKEIDLVSEYLIQGKDADVPFTPYLVKKQKKNISKLNSYNTRSKCEPKGG